MNVYSSFNYSSSGFFELPPERTWTDVRDWYVKWDTIYITFKDGETFDTDLASDAISEIDWKRPNWVEIQDDKYNVIAERDQ